MAELRLRAYQEEALEAFERHNLLVVLPTNTGKTIIAAEAIQRVLREATPGKHKAVFLAPTRALVEQQGDVLRSYLGRDEWSEEDPSGTVVVVSGTPPPSKCYAACDLVVSTPAIFLTALIHADIRMEQIAVLVLDEGHHCAKRDVYATIMRRFYRAAPATARPRVLTLTAMPIKSHIPQAPAACGEWPRPVTYTL
ncbi:hypothetical protein CYMTET_56973 [Cymbomonas tetramitiformis]|uniref:Helicase ATP-binding domain-containing protein n=1 Tax=Cymbomonas tetramitiformis TaxID=36881 RepID=A0AAE0EN77_9CHLO|nr:hypothetical protein CYMTET_56973 [Cymbomonas tetramitiformis]